jgi:hypothetical protein
MGVFVGRDADQAVGEGAGQQRLDGAVDPASEIAEAGIHGAEGMGRVDPRHVAARQPDAREGPRLRTVPVDDVEWARPVQHGADLSIGLEVGGAGRPCHRHRVQAGKP